MNAARLVLPLTAVACYGHPVPPPPPVPAGPAFTCTAPAEPATAPVQSADAARSLAVALVSGDAPDWSAPQPAPVAATAPSASPWAAPASAPAATPTSVWGASAPDAPDSAPSPWGAPAPAGPDSAPSPWGAPAPVAAQPAPAPASPWGGSPAIAAAPAAPVAPTWGAAADEPAPVEAVSDQAWFRTQAEGLIFSVQADGAPLGSMALEIGAALSLPVVVQPGIADHSITLSHGAVSLAELGDQLQEIVGAAMAFEDGILVISDLDAFVERNYATEPAPLQTLILPAPDGVPAEHVAATWCALQATARGTASVVGGAVIFQDAPDALDDARGLVDDLGATATALWADATASTAP